MRDPVSKAYLLTCGQCVFAPYVDWLIVPASACRCWQWTFGLIKTVYVPNV